MLNKLLTDNLLKAFENQLADAYKPFVLTRITKVIDEETDRPVTTKDAYNLSGCFGSFLASEADGTVVIITDIKLLVIQAVCPLKPQIGDIVDDTYRVSSVKQDPASVTWVLGLRGYNNGVE